MTTLIETRDRVRDFANKDNTVLPDSLVDQFLGWAADEAYYLLEIPPLERVITISKPTHPTFFNDQPDEDFSRVVVPEDTSRIISMMDVANPSRPNTYRDRYSYREFRDECYRRQGDPYIYTRVGNEYLFYPVLTDESALEIFYYARLADVKGERIDSASPQVLYYTDALGQDRRADNDNSYTPVGTTSTVGNWLRDQNFRVLLFGALYRAFDYLEENDGMERYLAKFQQEIQLQNSTENNRKNRGGSISMGFDDRNLL